MSYSIYIWGTSDSPPRRWGLINLKDLFKSQVALIGTMDGTNRTFLFPQQIMVNTERIFLNGQALKRNMGYTVASDGITMTLDPSIIPPNSANNDTLDADFIPYLIPEGC